MEVCLSPGYIVLDGEPAPPKGAQPQFSAHVCCGQTAGWIKIFGACLLWPNGWMDQGTEVGLGPGHIVLDGTEFPTKSGTTASHFSTQFALWHGRPSQQLLSSCLYCPEKIEGP